MEAKELLDKVSMREYGYIVEVVKRLYESYQLALTLECPRKIKQSISRRHQALEAIINSQTYANYSQVRLPHNAIRGRIQEYPITALLVQSFSSALPQKKRELLLLLTFIVVEILLSIGERENSKQDHAISQSIVNKTENNQRPKSPCLQFRFC